MKKTIDLESVHKNFHSVLKETEKKESGERCEHWFIWGVISWDCALRFYVSLGGKASNSVLLRRMVHLQDQLQFLNECMLFGAYDTTFRELRFIFESVIQAYYVEKEYPGTELNFKMEKIKEDKYLHGGKLIDRTNLENITELKQIFKELSQFTHSSHMELEHLLKRRDTYVYNRDSFERCYRMTNRVMDSIFFILLSYDRRMRVYTGRYEAFFEDHNCKLTLKRLKK